MVRSPVNTKNPVCQLGHFPAQQWSLIARRPRQSWRAVLSYVALSEMDKYAQPDKGSHVDRTTTSSAIASSTTNSQFPIKEPDRLFFPGPSGRLAVRALDLLLSLAGKSPNPAPRLRREISKAARRGPPDHRSTWREGTSHPEFLRQSGNYPPRRDSATLLWRGQCQDREARAARQSGLAVLQPLRGGRAQKKHHLYLDDSGCRRPHPDPDTGYQG